MSWGWWPDYNDAWNVLYPTMSCESWGSKGANSGFYCNEEVDDAARRGEGRLDARDLRRRSSTRSRRSSPRGCRPVICRRSRSGRQSCRRTSRGSSSTRSTSAPTTSGHCPGRRSGVLGRTGSGRPNSGRPHSRLVVSAFTLPVRPVLRLRSPAPRPRSLVRPGSRCRVRRSRRVPPPRRRRVLGGWRVRGRVVGGWLRRGRFSQRRPATAAVARGSARRRPRLRPGRPTSRCRSSSGRFRPVRRAA